jgi:hypothetical protein
MSFSIFFFKDLHFRRTYDCCWDENDKVFKSTMAQSWLSTFQLGWHDMDDNPTTRLKFYVCIQIVISWKNTHIEICKFIFLFVLEKIDDEWLNRILSSMNDAAKVVSPIPHSLIFILFNFTKLSIINQPLSSNPICYIHTNM